MVSPANADAVGRWTPGPAGPAAPGAGRAGGLGKTHLARAWAAAARAAVIPAKGKRPTSAPCAARPVLLEDVDQGDRRDETLFHLINMAARAGGGPAAHRRARRPPPGPPRCPTCARG